MSNEQTKPAVCIVGHGSRDPDGVREFERLVNQFRTRDPERIIEFGFLEFAQPPIQDGLERCVERGAKQVAVVPGVLMAAGHAKNDIPSVIHKAQQRHPGVSFHYGRHLHLHHRILELCRKRIEEAEARANGGVDRSDTLLLVVGRGSSDPDPNSDIQKLSRMLWDGMGFGWAETCFLSVSKPLLNEALPCVHRLGFRRVVVFPFLLFTGILEKRIRQQTHDFTTENPETEYLVAPYLNADDLLCDVFIERADEAINGSPNMNCQHCKYRIQLVGFESDLGAPQGGHHHHHAERAGQDHYHPGHHYGHHHSHAHDSE